MSKIMLIDGNSILNRAFYALPLLSNSKGVYTNAVYGFMNIFLKFYESEKPNLVAIAFDLKAPTFRHKMFAEYKGQRKGMPEELKLQVPIIKELIDKMHITRLEKEGYEADDIIGTLAKEYELKGYDVVVVSGDRDLLQVATDKINIKIPKTKKTGTEVESYFEKDVIEKMCVTPKEYIDVKALMGDTSDNIPGVPGVGEKTAFKLICEYKSLENIYENIDNLKGKLKENLENNKQLAFDCRTLATIILDAPYEGEITDSISLFNEDVSHMLMELETKALYERLKRDYGNGKLNDTVEKNKSEINTNIIDSAQNNDASEIINELESRLIDEGIIRKQINDFEILDEEKFTKLCEDIIRDKRDFIYKFYIEEELNIIAFILDEKIYLVRRSTMLNEGINENIIHANIKKIFEDKDIKKISYELKNDIKYLISCGIKVNNYYDVMIAYYVLTLSNGPYKLYDFAIEVLTRNLEVYERIIENKKDKKAKENIDVVNLNSEELKDYVIETMNVINDGYKVILERLTNNIDKNKLFETIENPLVEVLASMESNGIKVDIEELKRYATDINMKVKEIEKEIYKHAGMEFNISSPKQLADVLFTKLMLTSKKKTKTGMSTSAEVLEKLKGQHPIIDYIIEYRQLEKLRSTYADGMFNYIGSDLKIHTTFNQTVTSTGRLSSTDPNLQNIPIRMELGRKIRKAFIPEKDDNIFIDADYSQVELRIMAHMSGDKKLIDNFLSNDDIHKVTASEIFEVPFDEVTNEQRSAAKAVNFGIIYGISAFGLSNDINITRKEADKYINNYFEKYSRVKEYLDELIKNAEENGCARTLFGRERKIDELKSTNYMQREFGKRIAMNSPIQGTAADIMKLSMINFYQRIEKEKINAKIILQVHDELLIETSRNDKEKVANILKEEMENAAKLAVPLLVNVSYGDTWYESK